MLRLTALLSLSQQQLSLIEWPHEMALSSATTFDDSSDEEDDSNLASTESSTYELTPSSSSGLLDYLTLKADLVGRNRSCCCVSAEELTTHWMDQPFTGWQARDIEPPTGMGSVGSSHCISTQLSEKSLSSLSDTVSYFNVGSSQILKTNSRIFRSPQTQSRAVINLGSESKSSLRSYIHSIPAIPYTFHHHVNVSDGDTAPVYMEEYKRAHTYPNIQERSRKTPDVFNSMSNTTVKPTVFLLHNDMGHPLHYKKKQDNGTVKPKSRLLPYDYKSIERTRGNTVPPSGMQTVCLSRNRELGIPRNTLTFNTPQTGIIQVSSQSPTIQRSDKIVSSNENSAVDGRTATDRGLTLMTDRQTRNLPHPPPPTIWDSANAESPVTHVKPLPNYSKHSRRGLTVKPSVFSNPLPNRTVSSKKGHQSSHLTKNSKSSHQYSSPHIQKSSTKLSSHKFLK